MEHYHDTEETSKYNNALDLYPTPLTDEQVKSRTARSSRNMCPKTIP